MALPPAPASTNTQGRTNPKGHTMTDSSTRTAAETLTFADILAKAKPARRTVYLYLNGELMARRDELEVEIEEAGRIERLAVRNADGNPETSLGDTTPTDALIDELADVLEEMRRSKTRFVFERLPRSRWDFLLKEFEAADGKSDTERMSAPLVAESLVEPAASRAEVEALFETLNLDQRRKLFDGAWAVNTGAVDIPFSPAGSAAEKARASAKR